MLQLSAIHHPISSSFVGFLGTIAAGMVCYHLTVEANNMYQSLSITAKCRTVVLRWLLFAIGYAVISYMAYRRDVMHKKGWFRHIDSSSWHSFVLQGSYIDIALEAALTTMFLSLGMHSSIRFIPEMMLSTYPLVLCGAATFSIFIFHFRPCATLLWGDFSVVKLVSVIFFSIIPVSVLSYRCIEKYEVVGFWKPFKF
jgi:peptidoglycan/LPS O-acetylase OafA/YrhL